MALEDEVGRFILMTERGEKLRATLRAVDPKGNIKEETYLVTPASRPVEEVLTSSTKETFIEVGTDRQPLSFQREDAKLLFDPGINEVVGYQIGVLTIRKTDQSAL